MNKAKDEYYNSPPELEAKRAYTYIRKLEIENIYKENKISELEAENEKLIDDITDIGIEKIKLEAEKAEMLEILKRNYSDVLKINKFLSSQMYHPYTLMENEIKELLKKYGIES